MWKLMLASVLISIKMCLQVDSCSTNICECDKPNLTNQCNFTADQMNILTTLGKHGYYVNFPDSITIDIQISDAALNLSELNLNWIKKLNLSANNLKNVPDFIPEFTGIETLDLSQNKIEIIDSEIFRTLNIKQLNLSFNSVNCSGLLNLHNLTSLDLSNNHLEHLLPLSSLQYLNLSNNRLEVFNGTGFNSLQHLDVSWNRLIRIASIPNLTSLFVGGNTRLGNIFVFSKLQTFDASQTELKQVPSTLTQSIQFLRLTENLIHKINCGDLDSYPLLHSLDLTSNNIKFVEEDSLGRLEFLSILYLSRNKLEEIPNNLPEKLKVLHLDSNNIVDIPNLQGMIKLEELLLNDNNISVINNGVFSELISLIKLDLSGNPIITLQSGSFSGPLSLQILRLSSLEIISTNVDNSFPLSSPESLVSLDLSGSPGLARQFLSDTATLMASKRLQELDLSRGNLEYLRQDLQFFLPGLKSLRVDGDKLNSTQIFWIKSWLCTPANSFTAIPEIMETKIVTGNSDEENSFNEVGVMSKFSSLGDNNELGFVINKLEAPKMEKKNYFYRSLLLVLSSAGVVFSISVVLILRFIKLKRPVEDEVESTSLPTISDIW